MQNQTSAGLSRLEFYRPPEDVLRQVAVAIAVAAMLWFIFFIIGVVLVIEIKLFMMQDLYQAILMPYFCFEALMLCITLRIESKNP